MGLIYIITSTATPKQYIGQTNNTIQIRWSRHIASARRMIRYHNQPEKISNIYHSHLYRAMAKYGIHTFQIQLVEDGIFHQDILDMTEAQYIEEFNTRSPFGLNLLSGGGANSTHSTDTIQLMRNAKQATALDNRSKILDGLPALTTYKNDHLGERILINNHSLCKSKTFSVKTYGSIENVKLEVIKFLTELEQANVVHHRTKNGDDLLQYPGLIETPKGFRVNKVHKSITYDKRFERKTKTREENKQAAIEYYTLLLQKFKSQT